MMIVYPSRYLMRAEVWYDSEPDDTRSVDWVLYCRRSRPVPGAKVKTVYTYAIDLKQAQDRLVANLNKDTAYKIRRAREGDKVECEVCDPRDTVVVSQFEEMYNAFAEMKGLTPLNRPRMESMAAAGVLDLSVARDPQGNPLVYHANYRDHRRATSMELPSLYRKLAGSADRNFIGRANRLLMWSDILRYKAEGLEVFDFGGWYQGSDLAMLKINDFKRGFGGQVLREYECEQTLTLKGRVVLAVAAVMNKARCVPRKPQPASHSNAIQSNNEDVVSGGLNGSPMIGKPNGARVGIGQ
jgi:hypothetical protein